MKSYSPCTLLAHGRKSYAQYFVYVRYALFNASSVFYATFKIAHFGFTGGGQFTPCLTDLRNVRNLNPERFWLYYLHSLRGCMMSSPLHMKVWGTVSISMR